MKRIFKQLIYGAFYLVILGLIFWVGYSLFFKPAPTPQGSVQNEKEVLVPEPEGAVLTLESLDTEIIGMAVKVTGTLKNESPIRVEKVVIRAVIFDKEGRELFSSQTLEEDIRAFESRPFTVFFPKERRLREQVDSEATKVFFQSQ